MAHDVLAAQISSRADAIVFLIEVPVTIFLLIATGAAIRNVNHPELSGQPWDRLRPKGERHPPWRPAHRWAETRDRPRMVSRMATRSRWAWVLARVAFPLELVVVGVTRGRRLPGVHGLLILAVLLLVAVALGAEIVRFAGSRRRPSEDNILD